MGIFKAPKAPKPPPPLPAPSQEPARLTGRLKDRERRRRGDMSTIFAGAIGSALRAVGTTGSRYLG